MIGGLLCWRLLLVASVLDRRGVGHICHFLPSSIFTLLW